MTEYNRICRILKVDPKKDEEATSVAEELSRGRTTALEELKKAIKGKDIVVFGAGPSLEGKIKSLEKNEKIFICSDGTVSALLENGFIPEVNVTDLDGKLDDILRANELGTITVIHAHGDNINKLREYIPKFKEKIVLTTQTTPTNNVKNLFGFTDGDRAVSLARNFGARKIELIGFDFGDVVGKYSDPAIPKDHKASQRKKKKLEIAEYLVKKFLKNRK